MNNPLTNREALWPSAVSHTLWRDRHLVRPICSTSREVLGTCLGRGQVNHNCSYIQPVEGRTIYQLQGWNRCSSPYKQRNTRTNTPRSIYCQQSMPTACHRQWARGKIRTSWTWMGGALRHTVAIKMYETIAAECGRNMQVCRQVWHSTMWVPFGWSYLRHILLRKEGNSSCINLPRKV